MELPLSWAQSSPAVLGWICDPLPALPLPLQSREGADRGCCGCSLSSCCLLHSSSLGLEGDGKDTALLTPSSRQGPRQSSGIPVPLLKLMEPQAHFRAVRTKVVDRC